MRILYTCLLLVCFIGCGRSEPEVVVHSDAAITVDEWRQMEVVQKYEPETFDRLKLGDPKLEDEDAWDDFMMEIVVPERRKDIPTDY